MTETHLKDTRTIAVIGAGLMGHGIAYLLARAGHEIRVFDESEDMRRSLPARLTELVQLFNDDKAILERISCVENLSDAVQGTDFVFEAISETVSLKQSLFARLEVLTSADCLLCTNTSAIPITKVAAEVTDKTKVIGTHFWNPPHLVPLVEVIEMAPENRPGVLKTIDLLRQAGRHPVHVKKDVPGFIGNRLQHALKREAIALVASGVCDAETLDDVVKYGFGSRLGVLGPLEQSDLVGLNLTLSIHDTLIPDLDCTKGPHPLLVDLVNAGKLGMKTGEGFRRWTPEDAETVRNRLRDNLLQGLKPTCPQEQIP
jgi:3-hydroxybutyryl-CoA dehydrogenase